MHITLANKYFARVATGKKTITIRKGEKAVSTGQALLVSPDGIARMTVFITGAEHLIYGDLTTEHIRKEGLKTRAELKAELEGIYGAIRKSDPVTVIHFTTNVKEYRESRRPAQKTPVQKVARHSPDGYTEEVVS